MAKKERNRRSARQTRSRERAEREELQESSSDSTNKGARIQKVSAKETKPEKKSGKPGIIQRFRNYISDVRSEMRRVVWPSGEELRNYTLSAIAILIVAGVVVWLVDSGIVALLLLFSNLRG